MGRKAKRTQNKWVLDSNDPIWNKLAGIAAEALPKPVPVKLAISTVGKALAERGYNRALARHVLAFAEGITLVYRADQWARASWWVPAVEAGSD